MRRPVRPFTVEHKKSGRAAPTQEAGPVEMPPLPEPAAPKAVDGGRWAAAEALFSIPAPSVTAASVTTASGVTGRILPSLDEPQAPVFVFEDEAPKRRGRKPGSRNKTPKIERERHDPQTIDNVVRNVFEFWSREEAAAGAAEGESPAMVAPAPAVVLPPLELRRRGRIAREELPRGERWKARLPRFAR